MLHEFSKEVKKTEEALQLWYVSLVLWNLRLLIFYQDVGVFCENMAQKRHFFSEEMRFFEA